MPGLNTCCGGVNLSLARTISSTTSGIRVLTCSVTGSDDHLWMWGPTGMDLAQASSVMFPPEIARDFNAPFDDPTWQVVFRESLVRIPKRAPFQPTVHWSYHYAEDALWGTLPVPVNLQLLLAPPVVTLLPSTGLWVVDAPLDDPTWQLTYLVNLQLFGKAAAPFTPDIHWSYHYAEDALWGAGPNDSAVLHPLLTAAGIVTAEQWKWGYDDAAFWVGQPQSSDTIRPLLTAGGQPPQKKWRYDHDADSWWTGTPLSSDLLHPLLTAAGIVTAEQWKWGYDDAAYWNARPLGRFELLGGQVPTKLWRYDHDADSWWQNWLNRNLTALTTLAAAPFPPGRWNYNYDDAAFWLGQPLSSDLLHPLLTAAGIVTAEQQRFNYDVGETFWSIPSRSSALLAPLLTAGGEPFSRLWRWDHDADSWWSKWQQLNLPAISTLTLAPFLPARWNQHYAEDALWSAFGPLRSKLLAELLTAGGQVFNKQQHYDYDEASSWLIPPRASAVLAQLLAGKPFSKLWRYDHDADSWWQQWINRNLTALGSLAQAPFPPARWNEHYAEDALWGPAPLASTLLHPLLTAGGLVPNKQQTFSYDAGETFWSIPPRSSSLLVPLLATFPFSRLWRWDHDADSWWQPWINRNLNALIANPLRPGRWSYHYAEDALWGAVPLDSALLHPLLTAGGQPPTKSWRYDYDDASCWQKWLAPLGSTLLVPILTAGGQPPTKVWAAAAGSNYDVGDSAAYAWVPPTPFNIRIPARAQPFNVWRAMTWNYDYNTGESYFQWKPPNSPPLYIPPPPIVTHVFEWHIRYRRRGRR